MNVFSVEQQSRIIAAISERVGRVRTCPVCGHTQWTLADGLVNLSVEGGMQYYGLPAWAGTENRSLPAYALVCNKCGDIRLMSAAALGNPHSDITRFAPPPLPQIR